jgi:type IV pilus assembly protein PilQ
VQQAEITDVLRLIAEVSQLNLITSPEVQGKVTTRMMDVPWDQALDVILKLYSLGMERYGNVVLIAPLQQLVAQRQGHLRRQQAEDQAEAVVTRIIPVHYARAENLQPHVERFLGDCARVAIDRRTNSLILTGTPACLRLGTHRAP